MKKIARPVSHSELRAWLEITEKALKLKDIKLLENLSILSSLFDDEYRRDAFVYSRALLERLEKHKKDVYYVYDDETVELSKDALYRKAYGDFNEAMAAIERDLTRYPADSKCESDAFKPEYFDEEDRKIWDELRKVSINLDYDIPDNRNDKYVKKLRKHQEKSYGPQIPVLYASYISRDNQRGVTLNVAFVNGKLEISAEKKIKKLLEAHFSNLPITTSKELTKIILPKTLDYYSLVSVNKDYLFEYELRA